MEWIIFSLALLFLLLITYIFIGPLRFKSITGNKIHSYKVTLHDSIPVYIKNLSLENEYEITIYTFLQTKNVVEFFKEKEEYYDSNLLNKLHVILVDSINTVFDIKAYGLHDKVFSYTDFSNHHLIYISLDYTSRDGFNTEDYSSLFLHEYIHAWLEKNTGNSDPLHMSHIWDIIEV